MNNFIQLLYTAIAVPKHKHHRFRKTIARLGLGVLLVAGAEGDALGQGCIAIRNNPGSMLRHGSTNVIEEGEWFGSVAYRWFRSDRHFTGDTEHPERQRIGNEVINDVHSINLTATYGITPRWSVTLDVPFIHADRSSLYEHDLVNRHSMKAHGLGDVRVLTDVWLWDPHTHMDGNIALGIGFKAPTGDDHASDISYRATGPVVRPVDPSIQPGDGGWGIVLQMQAFQKVYKNLFAYVSGSYMMTPEEQSSTEFTIADVPAFQAFITDEIRHNTIADQYVGRGGFSYLILPEHGLSLSLGSRIEGIPAADVIGGDMGFRRPGYTVSIEPGVTWTFGKNSLSINTPVAVYRNRVRSEPEKRLGRPGGDSAFADYSILASYTRSF